HTYHSKKSLKANKTELDFKDVLRNEEELKVSKHAQARLLERNIHINDEKWKEIGHKVEEAKRKGVTDSVIVTKDATLIVSHKNKTVVTVLNHEEAQSKVFTNINGMILLNK